MGQLQNAGKLGLRDRVTGRIVAVYPGTAEGTDEEITEKVKYWYYKQDCEAEEEMRGLFVDRLTPEEEASHGTIG
jgi:hypothetical protein